MSVHWFHKWEYFNKIEWDTFMGEKFKREWKDYRRCHCCMKVQRFDEIGDWCDIGVEKTRIFNLKHSGILIKEEKIVNSHEEEVLEEMLNPKIRSAVLQDIVDFAKSRLLKEYANCVTEVEDDSAMITSDDGDGHLIKIKIER